VFAHDTPEFCGSLRTLALHTLYEWRSVEVAGPGLRVSASVG
jgi:hypothetical protein